MAIHEQHLVSDFVVCKRKNSSIIPGKSIDEWVFLCPVCSTEQGHKPAHRKHETCEAKCGASWIASGNRLDLTFEDRPFLQRVAPPLLR